MNDHDSIKSILNGHLKSDDVNTLVHPLLKGKQPASEYECGSLEVEKCPVNHQKKTSSSSPVVCNGENYEAWHLDNGFKDHAGSTSCRSDDETLESNVMESAYRSLLASGCKNDADCSEEVELDILLVSGLEKGEYTGGDLTFKSSSQAEIDLLQVPDENGCRSSHLERLGSHVCSHKESELSNFQDSNGKSSFYKRSKAHSSRMMVEDSDESILAVNNQNLGLTTEFLETL